MHLGGNRGHVLSVASVGDSFVSSAAHYNISGGVRVSSAQMAPAAAVTTTDTTAAAAATAATPSGPQSQVWPGYQAAAKTDDYSTRHTAKPPQIRHRTPETPSPPLENGSGHGSDECVTASDCYGGQCKDGTCKCPPLWAGPGCQELRLKPAAVNAAGVFTTHCSHTHNANTAHNAHHTPHTPNTTHHTLRTRCYPMSD